MTDKQFEKYIKTNPVVGYIKDSTCGNPVVIKEGDIYVALSTFMIADIMPGTEYFSWKTGKNERIANIRSNN